MDAFLYVLPLAFAVSSLVYGILGGVKKIAVGLLGVAVSAGLVEFYFIGLIFAGCYGWSVCI